MAFKFFTIPIHSSEAAEDELNAFVRTHKVLSVDRRWVEQGPESFWAICFTYADRAASGGSVSRGGRQRRSVDYREVLNEEDFAVFAKLRELRKELAQPTGAPVYTIFNNEQLAQMVQKRVRTKADLEAILGAGDARIEKYGERFLDLLSQEWGETDEAGGESV